MYKAVDRSISRRTFLGGVGGVVALGALAACTPAGGGGTAPTLSQPSGAVPAEFKNRVRTVAWTQWGGVNGDTFAALVKKFNESQEDIYLDLQVQSGSYDELSQKLATGLQAKQAPDLFSLSADQVGGFFLNGILEPLDSRFTKEFPITVFNESVIESSKISGSLWRLPIAGSTPIIVYNKDIFAQAGLPDRGPKTWTELDKWAGQLKGFNYNGTDTKMLAYLQADGDYTFQNVLWNFGGAFSDGLDIKLDSKESIAAGEFQRALVRDRQMAYMTAAPVNDFTNGLIATAHISSASLGTILATSTFEVGAAQAPAESERWVPAGGGGLSILAGIPEERKVAAFTFLEFLSQPENAAFWSINTGYMPIVDSALEDKSYLAAVAEKPQLTVAASQLDDIRRQDDIRMFVGTASATISEGLQRLYTSGDSTKDVFADVAASLASEAETIRADFESKVS